MTDAAPLIEVVTVVPETDTTADLSGSMDPASEVAAIQAISEGVPVHADTVECMGKRYRIADRVGLMPLMRFAHVSKKGVDSDDLEGLSAMYDMLRDCILPADWPRFEIEMTEAKADDKELFEIVGKTMELLAARPTRPSSGSSSTPAPTSVNSTDGSSRPAAQVLVLPATMPTAPPDLVAVNDIATRSA